MCLIRMIGGERMQDPEIVSLTHEHLNSRGTDGKSTRPRGSATYLETHYILKEILQMNLSVSLIEYEHFHINICIHWIFNQF